MKPIGKYIVVKTLEKEIKTNSGLVLSSEDANQFRYRMATVIAVGTDVGNIKIADQIYYDKAQSFTMIIKDDQYTIIQERDVVVVV
jgi:chaperonin GroES